MQQKQNPFKNNVLVKVDSNFWIPFLPNLRILSHRTITTAKIITTITMQALYIRERHIIFTCMEHHIIFYQTALVKIDQNLSKKKRGIVHLSGGTLCFAFQTCLIHLVLFPLLFNTHIKISQLVAILLTSCVCTACPNKLLTIGHKLKVNIRLVKSLFQQLGTSSVNITCQQLVNRHVTSCLQVC